MLARSKYLLLLAFIVATSACTQISGRAHYTSCYSSIRDSLSEQPQFALILKRKGTSERLLLVTNRDTSGFTVTGLNSLGAKRFTITTSEQKSIIAASPLVDKKSYQRLIEQILYVQAYLQKTSDSACRLTYSSGNELLLNHRDTGVSDLEGNSSSATFNISDLGYNVALSRLKTK